MSGVTRRRTRARPGPTVPTSPSRPNGPPETQKKRIATSAPNPIGARAGLPLFAAGAPLFALGQQAFGKVHALMQLAHFAAQMVDLVEHTFELPRGQRRRLGVIGRLIHQPAPA